MTANKEAFARHRPVVASIDSFESDTLMNAICGLHGVEIRARYYYLKRYPACFLGNQLVTFLVKTFGFTRSDSVRVGQRLLAQNEIRHVSDEHDFKDAPLFYAVFVSKGEANENLDLSYRSLAEMTRMMRGADGISVGRKRRFMVDYPECFVSSEAIDWVCDRVEVSRDEAIRIGRSMLQNNLIQHVFDEIHFVDGRHFYRFV